MATKIHFKGTWTPVEVGDLVHDFRGEPWYFEAFTRPGEPGRSAKINVSNGQALRQFNLDVFPTLEEVLVNAPAKAEEPKPVKPKRDVQTAAWLIKAEAISSSALKDGYVAVRRDHLDDLLAAVARLAAKK